MSRMGKWLSSVAGLALKPNRVSRKKDAGLRKFSQACALRMLTIFSSLLVTVASQASGIIPSVYIPSGASFSGLYTTPESACQTAVSSRQWNGPTSTLIGIFINSYVNGVIIKNWAAPYNTPNLGGWDCMARVRNTVNGTQFDSYPELSWMYPGCPTSFAPGTYPIGSGDLYCPPVPMYFTTLKSNTKSDNGPCCTDPGKVLIHDPINPATGNNTSAETDLTASSTIELPFNRYYNSTDSTKNTLGTGWRGSFSRSIQANAKIASYQPLDSSSVNSSLYNDEANACTSGFAQIKSQIPNWVLATASFSNGVCLLTQGGTSLGALPIYAAYNYQTAAEVSPPSFEIIRDDGQTIRFSVINGVITAPPSSRFKLEKSTSGYTLSDVSDNVETYDATGKLLTVTNRPGVVQTMSYDSSGRLSGVTDNFGHQLTFGYDGQSRLITVLRQ